MSHSANPRSRSWVAILAAYLLVVQAMFAGVAAGAYANTLMPDRTPARAYCAPSGDIAPGGNHDKSQAHSGKNCWTAGCQALVSGEPAPAHF
ncbi:hypothetical protein HDIA_4190 [Hartmannibacter diazotrophicus]|uniref:Uncharacterized protein n=1 Tax=Hartmannibacter diazotrophicus TaxID=1482074 RepID=A0A2C9DDA4_9HYPH|nr:hypothetical protein HDIA_4190 [Hartmannibacter diazotrophicus]